MMDVRMMAIPRFLRLLLHQVHLSLPIHTPLLRPHIHPRQSPQAVLLPKAMTVRLRLLRLRLQLLPLPRPSRLLRLPPLKLVAVAVTVATE
jgi:hypothetical protein